MGRRDRVDVITTKPEMSPEYMRSLSPEMNNALTAELCERMMCSGGGAEGRADIRWEIRRTLEPRVATRKVVPPVL